jgi:probable DNA repair protein
VVVAGLSEIREQVEQTFSAILHPEQYFSVREISPRAFDVSLGPALAEYPIIYSALIFLRLLSGSVSSGEFSAWLRSPYFGALSAQASATTALAGNPIDEQACARAVLDHRLSEALRPNFTLESILDAAGKIPESPAARQLLRQLRPARELARRTQALRPSLWLQEMTKALAAAGWPGEGRGLVLTSAEHQAREAWEDLLAEIGSVELVEPNLELAQVIERVVEAASAKVFKPQNQNAPVQVMGELEAAGSAFDALWIAGWSDSDWPRRHPPNPLIPLPLQREYNLPHHSAAAESEFARSVTARLLESAPQVVVSWPAAEEDRELRVSPLIRSIAPADATTASAGGPGSFTPTEARALRLSWPKSLPELFPAAALQSQMDDRAPVVAAGELRTHGVRILERQSNCPFRAFVELRLLASEQQPKEMGLPATDRGKLVETALQLAWEQLGDKFTLENCDEGRLQEIIQAAVDGAFRKLEMDAGDDWEARYFAVEHQRLSALLREWLEFERSREDFEVVDHQRELHLELAGMPLRVRPDRLDRLRDGSLVILDYKTGQQMLGPGQWRSPRPALPQLPSYAVALEAQSPAPAIAGVAFALVRRGECRMTGIGQRPEILGMKRPPRGEGLKESLASWRPELESLARDFMEGGARIDPRRDSTCEDTYCHLQAVCRMAEIDFPQPAETAEEHDADSD